MRHALAEGRNGKRPGTEEVNFGAEWFESQNLRDVSVIAWKRLIRHEGGDWGGRRFVGGNSPQGLSEAGAVAFAMRRATEFRVPEDSKRADFFTTK